MSLGAKTTLNYVLTSSNRATEDNIPYTAYGIGLSTATGTIALLQDISCKEEIVHQMIDMFNACTLPMERLKATVICLLP